MGRILLRALVFALTVTVASIAVDLLVFVLSEGGPPGRLRGFLVFRSALHGATLVLTLFGAAAGFWAMRERAIRLGQSALLGFVLGVLTLPVLLEALRHGGFRAMAAWLLVASFFVPVAGTMLLEPGPPAG